MTAAGAQGKRSREDAAPVGDDSMDPRERRKMQAQINAFLRMEEAAKRKERARELKAERESNDPCTCGLARERARLPKPLSLGGPRCNRCLAIRRQDANEAAVPNLPTAPTLYPTEDEFRYCASSSPRLPPPYPAGGGWCGR